MFKRTQSWRGPVFWARTLQIGLLCIIAIGMLGAAGSRFDRLGHEMMCSCGCGQVLLECNHVSCPSSPVMISELRTQLASGAGDTAVLNWFEAKYGATILAAPIRGGFDNVAWIVPIAVFLLATLGTFAVVWMWKRRAMRMADEARGYPCGGVLPRGPQVPESDAQDAALHERIRRETEY